MTAKTSSSKPSNGSSDINLSGGKNKSPILDGRYLLYILKSNWSLLILFFIIFFFTLTVPTVMQLNSLSYENDPTLSITAQRYYVRIIDLIDNLRSVFFIASVFCALFSGCKVLAFLHNKTSAGFYHSLPERRSGHFFAALISASTAYIAAVLINIVIVFISIFLSLSIVDCPCSEFILLFLSMLGIGVFYFFVFLSIVFLAGMVTGMSFMQSMMSFYISFVLPILYYAVIFLIDRGATYFDSDSFFDLSSPVKWLSPIFRLIIITEADYIGIWEYIVFDIIITAAFFIGAYYLYKIRPVESAGTPIIYRGLSETVKYSVMFPSAVLLGFVLDEIAGSFWLFFGLVAGALLAYMLCNTVFNRSAKAMFSGVRGLFIFYGAFTVSLVLFLTGFFGYIDYNVPAANKISISIDGTTYTLTDKDDVKKFRRATERFTEALRRGDTSCFNDSSTEYDYNKYQSPEELLSTHSNIKRVCSFKISYELIPGVAFRYRYNSADYEYCREMLSIIRESKYLSEMLCQNIKINYLYYSICVPGSLWSDITGDKGSVAAQLSIAGNYSLSPYRQSDSVIRTLDNKTLITDTPQGFQRQSVGYIRYSVYKDRVNNNGSDFYDQYYIENNLPLYFDNIEPICSAFRLSAYNFEANAYGLYSSEGGSPALTLDKIIKMTYNDFIDYYVESTTYIAVYDKKAGELVDITDKSKIKTILSSVAAIGTDAVISPFTDTSSDYIVMIKNDNEYDMDYTFFTTWFLSDKVPTFLE